MRISEHIEVAVPMQDVWDHIADPTNYLGFMTALTRWEIVGENRQGVGDRFRMLIRVGSADVGGVIEVVEWRPPRDMAFTSVTGVDQRGRWRLREAREGRTRVEFRYAYGVAGAGITGMIAERIARPGLRRDLRRSLFELKRAVEGARFGPASARRDPARA